jgi:hypothetical protein
MTAFPCSVEPGPQWAGRRKRRTDLLKLDGNVAGSRLRMVQPKFDEIGSQDSGRTQELQLRVAQLRGSGTDILKIKPESKPERKPRAKKLKAEKRAAALMRGRPK